MSAAGPLLRGLAPPLLILGAWQAAGTAALADPRLLPPPAAVAEAAWDQLARHGLLRHLAASLGRDLAGFSLGAAAGVAFGGLAGLSRLADRLLRPGFDALKSVAVFAWIPLIALWFGIGETSKVVFIALATFWPVAVNTWEGVARVPAPLREVAAALTLSRAQRLRHLVWPSALPAVLTGVQLGLIHSWLATVGSEYFLSKGSDIGGILVEGRERFDMPLVILGVAVLGLVGFALNRLAQLAGTRLAPWRQA